MKPDVQCGADIVTRDQLATIAAPDGTDTWFPIKHYTLLQKVEAELAGLQINVTGSVFAVAKEGLEFFATLHLDRTSLP